MANTVVTKGTAYVHGVAGTPTGVTGITVQSYTVSTSFANNEEVTDAAGNVVGVRMSDKRQNLTIEGLVPTSCSCPVGGDLTFTGNGIAFAGHITQVEERGEAKGFMRISITAVDYEGF